MKELFGIKVILIEPGVVNTNFVNNLKTGKRIGGKKDRHILASSPPPYSEIMEKRVAGFRSRFERGSPPADVAKIILKSVKSDEPELRYLVGNDAFKLRHKEEFI